MKTSYDVTFVPMTNVTTEVQDPRKITEEEQKRIVALAAKKIADNFQDKINCENLAEIRLHEIDGKATEEKTVANKTKNLLEDVYDVLASNNNYITQKVFTKRHAGSLEIDYDKLEIRLDRTHVLRIVEVNR